MICGVRPAITDDGPRSACHACIYRIGSCVNDPGVLTDSEVIMLLEAHGDVVELNPLPIYSTSQKVTQRWKWIAPDLPPGVASLTLQEY